MHLHPQARVLSLFATKETALPTSTDNTETNTVRARAEANFKKEERAREGAQAMLEYQANGRDVRENMAKLKALRLAKEAAEQVDGVAKKSVAKGAAKVASVKAKVPSATAKVAPAKAAAPKKTRKRKEA
jgi:aminoglycoside N3'-acetyltransferase